MGSGGSALSRSNIMWFPARFSKPDFHPGAASGQEKKAPQAGLWISYYRSLLYFLKLVPRAGRYRKNNPCYYNCLQWRI
jgi:hypothetical protein